MMRLALCCTLGTAWLLAGMPDSSSPQTPDAPPPIVVPNAPVPSAPIPAPSAPTLPTPTPALPTPAASEPLTLVLTVPSSPQPPAAPPAQPRLVYETVTLPAPRSNTPVATIDPSAATPGAMIPTSSLAVGQTNSVKPAEFVITISETPVAPEVARSLQAAEAARSAALPPSNSPATFPRGEPAPARKSYVDLSAAPCFGHAPDYNWIIGQVEYSSVAKEWRLRYASVDETDRYGGRVSLIENYQAGLLREGMYVQVRGHLVNPENNSNCPTYYRIEWYRNVDNPNVEQTAHPQVNVSLAR